MEFINFLIRPKGKMCFLCFNETKNVSNIYSDLEIEEKFFSATSNLANMVKFLFPYFDITFPQSCEDCFNLILKTYISIRRNVIIKKILNTLIEFITKDLKIKCKEKSNNIYLKIDLSGILSLYKNEKSENNENNFVNIDTNEDVNNEQSSIENVVDDELHTQKQCMECQKVFNCIKLYKKHIRFHKQKQKHYSCEHCDYKSLCKLSVQGHMNKFHLKSRPYVCDICFKSFYHKKNLTAHVENHSQLPNKICEVCGQRFLHKKNLLEHLKLHTGVRPYQCDICGKRFITSGRRLEHIKRVHSEKTESCLLCDKKFSMTKELTRHMKTVHSSMY